MRGLRTGSIAVLLALALAVAFPAAVSGQTAAICNNQVTVTANAATVVAITGVAGTTIFICSAFVTGASAQTFAVLEGTGALCATGTLGIVGTAALSHFAPLAIGTDVAVYRTMVAGNDVCFKAVAATAAFATFTYVQRR